MTFFKGAPLRCAAVPAFIRLELLRSNGRPVWEDIERQAEECLVADNNVARRSHFLGAIVLNVARLSGRRRAIGNHRWPAAPNHASTVPCGMRDYAIELGSNTLVSWLD